MSLMPNESATQSEATSSSTLSEIRKSVVGNESHSATPLQKPPLLHHDDHEHSAPHPARAPGRISRTLVNFWLDGLLGLLFVSLCIVAVIVQFVFPPGVSARGALLWRMTYGQWCSIQFGVLAVFGLGVLLHVMLHWTWICSVLSKRVLGQCEIPDDGIRTLYGVGLLIGLLLVGALCVGLAQWMIVLPG
jgi:hypothetical protein